MASPCTVLKHCPTYLGLLNQESVKLWPHDYEGRSNFNESVLTVHVFPGVTIFFNLAHTSCHLHPLQVENCDSNSVCSGCNLNAMFKPERPRNN